MQILIADQDECIANALHHNLRAMGFNQVHVARNGSQAMNTLARRHVHFVITEWGLPQVDGISMVRHIRSGDSGIPPTIPIIMLTGRGELQDIYMARDSGINEFVVKPFTARTLYSRIEQLVDHPRPFIVSATYNGPERRRRNAPCEQEQRRIRPRPVPLEDSSRIVHRPYPIILPADFALRHAIGISDPLSSIITQEILREAQKAIDALASSATEWVRTDIHHMQQVMEQLRMGFTPERIEQLKNLALSVKSRAGVFGFPLATDVARSMYLFLCGHYHSANMTHHLVAMKHLEVLMVIFGNTKALAKRTHVEILQALHKLVAMAE